MFSSVAQLCLILCDPMNCSMPGLLVHNQVPGQTHVHQVSDSIQPFYPLLSPSPPAFNLFQVFSNESVLLIRWPKYWSFSFSISPSNEYSGLISFRMDWFDLLAVQRTLKSLPQHHSSKAWVLWCSANRTHTSLWPTHTSVHDYWKNHSFDYTYLLLARWCLCFLICYLRFS